MSSEDRFVVEKDETEHITRRPFSWFRKRKKITHNIVRDTKSGYGFFAGNFEDACKTAKRLNAFHNAEQYRIFVDGNEHYHVCEKTELPQPSKKEMFDENGVRYAKCDLGSSHPLTTLLAAQCRVAKIKAEKEEKRIKEEEIKQRLKRAAMLKIVPLDEE